MSKTINNEHKSFENHRIGALDRDGDRSRWPAAHPHRFGRISGSIFDVKSMKRLKTIEPTNHPKLKETPKLEKSGRNDTKMSPASMPKGTINQC